MSRKGAAAAADRGAGTFDEMMSAAPAARRTGWASPRPLEEVDEAEALERATDPATVESMYDVLDHVLPTLKPNDKAVYLKLFRDSHGKGRATCLVKLPELSEWANLSISGVQYSVGRLKRAKLIKEVGKRYGRNVDQGVEFEVKIPAKR